MKKNHAQKIVKAFNRDKYLYILIFPGIMFFIIFHYLPMGGILIAFKDYDIFKGVWQSPWVGLQNFKDIFNSYEIWNITRNTFLINIYKMMFGFPVPLVLALLLNEIGNTAFKRTTQSILYIPHFISWVIIGNIIFVLLSPNYGIVNNIISSLGGSPINFMVSQKYFRAILVISNIWREAGYGTIIYLAAITQIDKNLYEAAIVDGAGRWRQTFNITLPSIKGVIIMLLIIRTGSLMNDGFEQIIVLVNPLVREISDIFDTYVYRIGLGTGRYSFAAGIGLFKSVISLILILMVDRIAKLVGEEGLL